MSDPSHPFEMPALTDFSDLSLNHLLWLESVLSDLCDVGRSIVRAGYDPVFDLSPGQVVRVKIGALQVFADPQKTTAEFARQLLAETRTASRYGSRNSPPAVPDADGAAVEPAPAVALTAAGADADQSDADEGLVTEVVEAMADPVKPLDAMIAEMQAEEDAATDDGGDPGPVVVEGKVEKAQRWTEEEDRLLVTLVSSRMANGLKLHRAALEAAVVLGRPEQGTSLRARTILSNRIYDALRDLKTPGAKTKPAPEQTVAPVAGGGQASTGAGVAATVPGAPKANPGRDSARGGSSSSLISPPRDVPVYDLKKVPSELLPVAQHLRSVTPFGKFTPAIDRDFIRLAEEVKWPLHEICLELDVPTKAAQSRLSVLTKGQAFKRAEVWAAMQAMGYGEANA